MIIFITGVVPTSPVSDVSYPHRPCQNIGKALKAIYRSSSAESRMQ